MPQPPSKDAGQIHLNSRHYLKSCHSFYEVERQQKKSMSINGATKSEDLILLKTLRGEIG